MSNRTEIIKAWVKVFKTIDGTGYFQSNLFNNVEGRLRYWDEVNDYPYVCVVAGDETREYLPGGFKWAFLNISIKIYTKSKDPQEVLEHIIEDIELLIDSNNGLVYKEGKKLEDIKIITITTDEGLTHPYGIGEILLQTQYEL